MKTTSSEGTGNNIAAKTLVKHVVSMWLFPGVIMGPHTVSSSSLFLNAALGLYLQQHKRRTSLPRTGCSQPTSMLTIWDFYEYELLLAGISPGPFSLPHFGGKKSFLLIHLTFAIKSNTRPLGLVKSSNLPSSARRNEETKLKRHGDHCKRKKQNFFCFICNNLYNIIFISFERATTYRIQF